MADEIKSEVMILRKWAKQKIEIPLLLLEIDMFIFETFKNVISLLKHSDSEVKAYIHFAILQYFITTIQSSSSNHAVIIFIC